VHISELLHEVLDDEHAPEWVDKLIEIKSGKWTGPATRAPSGTRVYEDVSFQVFQAPWPVSNREMLMHRKTWITPSNRTARITFEPIAGGLADFPEGRGHVRGEASSTFEFVASDRELGTRIVLVGVVDPKGSLPTVLINLLNKDWAANTISGLLRQSRRKSKLRTAVLGAVTRGACKGVDVTGWGSMVGEHAEPTWSDWLLGVYAASLDWVMWPLIQPNVTHEEV
jgi:hypothetical protein